jgi:CCR4-NOT transcription complex subunit 1
VNLSLQPNLIAYTSYPGQHHLLSAIVLHLRYPNAHTYWFRSLMLHFFAEIKTGRFQEIVTRILLERFIVHRPHPWGALFTFIELLRNSDYDFWSKDFVREVPEVTLLLESVSSVRGSCEPTC